jgi:hypothetical protein
MRLHRKECHRESAARNNGQLTIPSLVIEAKIGKGRIIVCGFDLTRDLDDPISPQMCRSLLDYMAGHSFTQKARISLEQVLNLAL